MGRAGPQDRGANRLPCWPRWGCPFPRGHHQAEFCAQEPRPLGSRSHSGASWSQLPRIHGSSTTSPYFLFIESGKVSSSGSLLRKPTQSLAPRKAVGRPGRLVSRETPWERKNTGSSFMGGGLGKISVQVKGEQHAGCVLRCLHHREGPEISRTRPETVVP